MSVEAFVNAGFSFGYCMDCVMPQIPTVQDVMYALHMSDQQESYDFCQSNHEPYVANVHLVTAAAGFKVLVMRPRDEQAMRKLIAEAIVALCPDEACCTLFASSAYVKARREAGLDVPMHDPATCPHCLERERRDNKPVPPSDEELAAMDAD
ncbi:MAG: hypothetical protein PHC70_04480 [Patescibacteria group bacterium]|nr:hypothetical protein [Patescibacteria group bacterium]